MFKPAVRTALSIACLAGLILPPAASAASLVPLEVAFAGSMGAVMDKGITPAVSRELDVDLHGRGQGAMALAHLITGGSLRPDVFVSVTPGPMKVVLDAGLASRADAIARTQMVIAYSPRSRFASALAASARPGHAPWWRVLESPGFRFGRTDPSTDPQGKNILFMLELASSYYHQPDLVSKIAGPTLNSAQIFPETQVMARLQSGQLDASSAYRTQPAALHLPYLTLPAAINLGEAAQMAHYKTVSLRIGARVSRPSPLIFYAAVLKTATHPRKAKALVHWLRGARGQAILRRFFYDGPGSTPPLVE